jgi:hypothetical protein
MTKATKIISYVLIVLALVGVIGFIAKFTSGFTSDFKTFYVTIDDKDIMSEANHYAIGKSETMTVDVKYTFNSSNSEVSGYSVKIVPNTGEDKNFDFLVDGEVHSFYDIEDLSAGFIIEESENSFTVTPKGGLTDILRAVYPNGEVDDCSEYNHHNMLSLVITSYNGASTVIVNFAVLREAEKVFFDKEAIVF